MTAPIQDLRDAIALLQQHDNQYLETDHPVDPNAELAGVYRHIGAGGTVKRPTRIGPAMMFNNIKGYPHSRILVGMHASRQRAALLLGCEASQLALEVGKAVKKPVAPVVVPASSAPCQEQIFLADDPDFDLRTLLPAPTNTPIDAGPFFCLGLALATYSELKNIILVDEDVDIFDSDDILWAMTTRMQGDVNITTIPGIRGHQLDPSQTPEYSPSIRGNGISCKTIFDCTVPWALKSHFERAPFADVDPRPFAPEYFARLEKNQGSAK
ncbi:hypothetical protein CK502_23745 [Klebsiella pneumoniae]|uniref:UbiD family decarboxylase domain-containing protein n=1 Tax=Klebsiella pneumoniae TaxID=573 RepID=UPI000BB146A2|nr:UbiD family decarboxylase domain-containing protein [Klebsiella pneumoniae]PBD53575.1 hypothetical protein CK502_23745 [Klebsiella pneumoniae]